MFRKIASVTILIAFVLAGCSSTKKTSKKDPEPTESQMKEKKKDKKKMAKSKKTEKKKKDCDKDKKKHKHLFKYFKKLDGFKASTQKRDGKAVVMMTANKEKLDKLQKKGQKLVDKINKHRKHKKKKHKKDKKKADKKHKAKSKKHRKKMKALHRATIEYNKTDMGAEIVLTPKKSKDLDYLMDYADWKAKLLNEGGCKKCADKDKKDKS